MNRAGSHGRDDAAREEKAGAGPRAEAQAWLLLLTSGRATEADAEDFQRWRRADPGMRPLLPNSRDSGARWALR